MCQREGVPSAEAAKWRREGFHAEDAVMWYLDNFEAAEAAKWRDLGFDRCEARQWRRKKSGPGDTAASRDSKEADHALLVARALREAYCYANVMCGEALHDHDWTSEGEGDATRDHCRNCGLHRTTTQRDGQSGLAGSRE